MHLDAASHAHGTSRGGGGDGGGGGGGDNTAKQSEVGPRPQSPLPVSPPYWTKHGRTLSDHSLDHARSGPGLIALEDHTDDRDPASQGCWARSVAIDHYTVLTGPTGIGAYVVWHCTVRTLAGGDLHIRKRYSEFAQLRQDLSRCLPRTAAGLGLPSLPRKSVVSRFRPWFLEERRVGLERFLGWVVLNPEVAGSPVVKEFIFS